jgi:hypothetical protein
VSADSSRRASQKRYMDIRELKGRQAFHVRYRLMSDGQNQVRSRGGFAQAHDSVRDVPRSEFSTDQAIY